MRITEAESVVMDVLWDRDAPLTADEIFSAVATSQAWQEPTVKTLLNRLLKKKAIAAERDGRRYLYRPLVLRNDYVLSESKSFLDRLHGGRVGAFVLHFSEHGKLSQRDIRELKALIEELGHDKH
jgi:predicted transcriptional regulator